MRRIRSAIALALLALWLPATLHCELELAGVFASEGCHDQQGATSPDTDADGCMIVENGGYRIDALTLRAADMPALWVLFVLAPQEMAPLDFARLEATAAPPDVLRTWQFVMRAAPPPRAPAQMG